MQGIWKLFKQIGEPGKRREILDWYHLKIFIKWEATRIKKAKNILWSGKVDETILLFNRIKKKLRIYVIIWKNIVFE